MLRNKIKYIGKLIKETLKSLQLEIKVYDILSNLPLKLKQIRKDKYHDYIYFNVNRRLNNIVEFEKDNRYLQHIKNIENDINNISVILKNINNVISQNINRTFYTHNDNDNAETRKKSMNYLKKTLNIKNE